MEKPFLIYTALGDSLTKGRGSLLFPNFVQHYAQMTESVFHKQVIIHNYSKGGLTSDQILTMFSNPMIRYAIYHSDMLTITAGGNDLIKAGRNYIFSRDEAVIKQSSQKAIDNIRKMINEIFTIKSGMGTTFFIRLVDLYNPVPKMPNSDLWIQTFNKSLKKFSKNNISVTNIYQIFKKERKKLLSVDGLHPNKHGYQIIAEELHRLGYEPLVRKKDDKVKS